ncbi:MAG: flagellar hook-basal body complex protein FliE [bacterium]|nr:flagellar hook-basal body complex protein FliE [bacterium]
MDFSTTIQGFDNNYNNINAINDYNKFLQGKASFEIDTEVNDFEKTLDSVVKSVPVKDKNDPNSLGSFMNNLGQSFAGGLNMVNDMKIQANKMQEDLAMGGPTSIHEAMIAAEKAELSMQMAVQVRNKILNAYSEITTMGL